MDFWNDKLTEKSWKILQDLKGFEYILIGGWAAYLWTRLHKSKDIDIVVSDYKDLEILKNNYDLKKNDNLKKYEIQIEEIDIDIYLPYFSKLSIPVEDIKDYSTKIQGFDVVRPEILLILKQGAELDRMMSVKGQKDRIDIMTLLLNVGIDFRLYNQLIKKYNLVDYRYRLIKIIKDFDELKYVDLSPRELKLRKKEIVDKLHKAN